MQLEKHQISEEQEVYGGGSHVIVSSTSQAKINNVSFRTGSELVNLPVIPTTNTAESSVYGSSTNKHSST